MKNKSFTLLEMMVVLVIIFIITAVAMPNFWGGYKGKEAKGTANRIASVLRAAKSYAQAQNRPYDVLYWYNNNSSGETNISIDIYDDFNTNGYTKKVGNSLKIHLNSQYTIATTMAPGAGHGSIAFYTDGHADDADGGSPSDETITLTMPEGQTITITVNENTSYINVGDIVN
jgi:Tfp pilus assembly protein FimT